MSRILDVYLHQALVGRLIQDEHGQMVFDYTQSWLEHANAKPLSHSLLLRVERFKPNECRGFFAGILPEEGKRKMIAQNFGISARNDFAMLEQIGGECVGAVTFMPEGHALPSLDYHYRDLNNKELASILEALPNKPLMSGDEDVRLSLAGAQDKIAVHIAEGKISVPLGGAPSAHLLKPAIERFGGFVFNEAFCIQLAAAMGLLRAVSSAPVIDLQRMLDAIIFNFLVGNNEAHGKNFSLLYNGNNTRLAPLYDILSTVYYPQLSKKMAMKMGGEYEADKIFPRHFEKLAEDTGLGKALVKLHVPALAEKTIATLDKVDLKHSMVEKLSDLIFQRCRAILKRFGRSIQT